MSGTPLALTPNLHRVLVPSPALASADAVVRLSGQIAETSSIPAPTLTHGDEARDMFARLDAGRLRKTPTQPEGPFFPVKTRSDEDNVLVTPAFLSRANVPIGMTPGEWTLLKMQVVNASGAPLRGVEVFLWQADHQGLYDHPEDPRKEELPIVPNFQYWGRAKSDENGQVAFTTVMPGHYPASPNWMRPPHFHLAVRDASGQLNLVTQLYRSGHALNDGDEILRRLPVQQWELLMIPFNSVKGSEVFPHADPRTVPETMLSGATRLVLPD